MPWSSTEDARAPDGTRLALYRSAEPAGALKADVVLIHGFAEHLGRYNHVVDALVSAGYRVRGVDLRGHGQSDGKRGFVRRWRDYGDDALAAIARCPTEPFVVAHSMGALVALDLLREQPIRGLVLSSPLLRPIVDAPAWKKASARLLSRITPWLSMGNELDPTAVTRDEATQRAYGADPLVFQTVTPRWYTEMLAASARVRDHAARFTAPALIQVGSAEKVVDPQRVADLAREWGGPAEFIRWDGLYHELMNEPERAEVLSRVIGWLDRQVTLSAAR